MRFRVYIAIPALSAALALLGLVAPVAAQASAASTAPTAQLRQGANNLASILSGMTLDGTTYVDGYQVYCYSPGEQFTVNADNIHIRSAPDGSILYSIAKGAHFDSNWHLTCGGFTTWYLLVTVEQYGGQQWVHGWSHADPSHVGWVGGAYLWFNKYCTSNGC